MRIDGYQQFASIRSDQTEIILFRKDAEYTTMEKNNKCRQETETIQRITYGRTYLIT